MSMKKSIKLMMGFALLLALPMLLTSCEDILGHWEKPTPVTPSKTPTTPTTVASAVVTADQTTITLSSLNDMDKAVSAEKSEELAKAIKAKADAGEVYTINIKSEEPLSTENFKGLEIPSIEGGNVNLTFDQPLVTSESNPLKVTASEKKSDTPTDAVNELTVTLPDGSDKVYLNIDMPETTVTLDGNVDYEYVEAITATNTLYISSHVKVNILRVFGGAIVTSGDVRFLGFEPIAFKPGKGVPIVVKNGATIKELQYKPFAGINVTVEDGGAIETFVYSPREHVMMGITEKGLGYAVALPGLDHAPIAKKENGNAYFIPNLKVIKGDADCLIYNTFIVNNPDMPETNPNQGDGFKKLIIGDGAVVRNMNFNVLGSFEIAGDGNATYLYGFNSEEINPNSSYPVETKEIHLQNVKSISGVTFKPNSNINGVAKIVEIPNNTKDCTFEAEEIELLGYDPQIDRYIASNNTYKYTNYFGIRIPGQPNNIPQFDCLFDQCTFSSTERLSVALVESKPVFDAAGNPVMVWCYFDTNGNFHKESNYSNIPATYQSSAWQTQDTTPINFSNYNCNIKFNSCKYGNSGITKSTPFLKKQFNFDRNILDLKFVINGTAYDYQTDPTTLDITLQ